MKFKIESDIKTLDKIITIRVEKQDLIKHLKQH